MKRVLFDGWNAGFRKISFSMLLRKEVGYSLARAKAATDSILGGQSLMIEVPDENFDRIVAELNAIGVKFSVGSNSSL